MDCESPAPEPGVEGCHLGVGGPGHEVLHVHSADRWEFVAVHTRTLTAAPEIQMRVRERNAYSLVI